MRVVLQTVLLGSLAEQRFSVMAGYSKSPLVKKLGIAAGSKVCTENAPKNYRALLGKLPEGAVISNRLRRNVDVCHMFTASKSVLFKRLPTLKSKIKQNGMIWVSWPKKASGVPSDLGENDVRAAALPLGLVDVKVCAVNDVWSGLKLVIRKELRSK